MEDLTALRHQLTELRADLARRKRILADELADVDRVKRPGLKRLYHSVMGNLDTVEQVEQVEADRAEAAYLQTRDELTRLQARIAEIEAGAAAHTEHQHALRAQLSHALASTAPPDVITADLDAIALFDGLLTEYQAALDTLDGLSPEVDRLLGDGERGEREREAIRGLDAQIARVRASLEPVLAQLERADPEAHKQLRDAAFGLEQDFYRSTTSLVEELTGPSHEKQRRENLRKGAVRVQSVAIGLQGAILRAGRSLQAAASSLRDQRHEHVQAAAAALGL